MISILTVLLTGIAFGGNMEKPQIVNGDEFQVIGIKTRTSIQEDMNGGTKIRDLWQKFMAEGILEKIPGRTDKATVSVYHDYEQNKSLPYTLLIGARVAPSTKAPPGMEVVKVPKHTYAKFITKKGEIPGVIMATWKNIWDLHNRGVIKREFSVDYEVYGDRAVNPKSAEVDIFISTK